MEDFQGIYTNLNRNLSKANHELGTASAKACMKSYPVYDHPNCYKLFKLAFIFIWLGYNNKNAAKRSRQHAGKKYQEYGQRHQRHVCFVNEQVH